MKRFYLCKLLFLIVMLSGFNWVANAQTSTYNFTGGSQTYTVPSGTSSIYVDMRGAVGGNTGVMRGGYGGRVTCTLAVTPGQVLNLYVGGVGGNSTSTSTPGASGYNNSGLTSYMYAGGGGGSSDIRMGGTALSNRVVVAGGGGGASRNWGTSNYDRGGDGGGLTGEQGFSGGSGTAAAGGRGGTQSAGGAGGTYSGYGSGGSGTLGQGGNGASGTYGPSGGGGYYGGGGGSWAGGGGGSSYTHPSLCTGVSHSRGFNTGTHGSIIITRIGPGVTCTPGSLDFGFVTTSTTSAAQTFTVTGNSLTSSPITVTAPSNYQVSIDGSTWVGSFNISFTAPTLNATVVYVRFQPTAATTYSSNISFTGGGLSGANLPVVGVGAAACSGTPTGGTTVRTPTSATPTTPIALSLSGSSAAGGLAYQWQRSADNTTWTNITGATNATTTFTGITGNTYFRCVITCISSTGTANSSSSMVTFVLPPSTCTPNYFYTCSSYPMNVSINRLNGWSGSISDPSTSCSANYTDNTSMAAPTLLSSTTYSVVLSGPPSYFSSYSAQMWIDFNSDGGFVSSESVGGISFNFPSASPTTNIVIPAGASPGLKRMRIVGNYNSVGAMNFPSINPCPTTATYYGQTRDYAVNIIPPPPTVIATPTSLDFGPITTSTTSPVLTYSMSGTFLTAGPLTVTAPTGYQVSPDGSTGWTSSLNVSYTPPNLSNTVIYVRFTPPAATSYCSSPITITGGGLAAAVNVSVCGTGAAVCSGTPTAGTAAVSPTSAATITPITMSVSGMSVSGGFTYQWQSSPNNSTWTNISGATNYVSSFSGITTNTYVRLVVTCSASSTSANSASAYINYLVPTVSCIPSCAQAGSFCGNNMVVASSGTPFRLTGELSTSISDNATCTNGAPWKDFSASLGCTLWTGSNYICTLGNNVNGYPMSSQMWIDFNGNANFESSESVGGGSFSGVVYSPTVTIPATGITPGIYRLRVIAAYASGCNSNYPCFPSIPPCPTTTVQYCEVRDYKVEVQIHPPEITRSPSSLAFGFVTNGTTSPVQTFSVTGGFLTSPTVTVTAPTGYEVSTTGTSGWASSVNLTGYTMPDLPTRAVYIRFAPTATATYNGTVTITGGGITVPVTLTVTGNGVPLCTGTPSVVVATASPTSGNPATVLTAGLTGITAGGLRYQWQSSAFSAGGFTNIVGATNFNYVFSGLTTPTWYRAVLSCPAGGSSTPSTPVQFTTSIAPTTCSPTCLYNTSFCGQASISSSSFPLTLTGDNGTSINDATDCSNGTTYRDYTSTIGLTLSMGGAYVCSTGVSSSYQSVQMWIDFNNDGIFVASETIGGTNNFNGRAGTDLNIPTGLIPGLYRLRVVETYNGNTTSANYPRFPAIPPCTSPTVYYAETRDYRVNLQYPPCSGVPVTGLLSSDISVACNGYTSELLMTSIPLVSGVTYNWQSSTTSATTGFSNISGATLPFYTAAVGATTWYRQRATCANGGLSGNSAVLSLIVNTPPAAITGSTSICMANPAVLTSATSGGTWSSSNLSIATVDMGTGLVTGVTPGAVVITYTLPTTCFVTETVTILPSPAPITGPANVCSGGGTTTLACATAGGAWSSADATMAAISSAGIVTGGSVGLTYITYTAPNTCTSVIPMTVNVLPPAITGVANVCVGSSTALYNSVPGGVWTTSSVYNATIGSLSGIVSGEAAGVLNMTYTLPTGCNAVQVVVVNDLPSPITGSSNVCVGGSTSLTNMGGGTWSSSNLSLASVDMVSGLVDGVNAGLVDISYTLPTGCSKTLAMTVRPKPAVHTVTGGGNYCPGGVGVHIGLSGSNTGVTYMLHDGTAAAVGSPLSGTASGLDFGFITTSDTYTIEATDGYGCTNTMAGSATVGFNLAPTAFPLTGGGSYCSGGTGVAIGVSNSEIGTNYQTYLGATLVGVPVVGTGAAINMGTYTNAGDYTVIATNASTTCSGRMIDSAVVQISPLPNVETVSPSGSYCVGGAGVEISLPSSTPGITYEGFGPTGSIGTQPGTGGSVSFGFILPAGTYTVVATDITNGCNSRMSGTPTITINPLPSVYAVTGGGNYCAGGAGVRVGVSYSVLGVNYRLNDGTGVVNTVAGSNSGLDFGLITTPGNYTVDGITAAGCVNNMAGTATVVVNPMPVAQTLLGGGGYCTGSPANHITTSGSEVGFNYQLYRGTTAVGAVMAGTGGPLDFGAFTTTGTYTARAINPATGCNGNMSGSVNVFVNALPNMYILSGGGNYCNGGTGVHITLNNSQTGVTYELYNGTTPTGIMAAGASGMPLDFGLVTVPGIYTAVATSTATGCTRTMSSSATVNVLPLPADYAVTGGGNFCVGGAGVNVGMGMTNTGIRYQLMQGTVAVGAPLWGTGAAINFGRQTNVGTYNVVATNGATGCVSNMTGTVNVATDALPIAYTVTGGGNFCPGGTGVTVDLSSSDLTDVYSLYRGTTLVASAVAGTGSTLSFGTFTTPGVYTAVATNAAGCNSSMMATATVGLLPVPAAFDVTGGGSYCVGGTGVPVGLANSVAGIDYELFNGTTSVGVMSGTGAAISFGAQTAVGAYNVVATNTATTCTSNMSGSAAIATNPLVTPGVTLAPGAGVICDGGSATINATPVNGGAAPVYEWKVGGVTVAGVTGATYSYVPVNGDEVSVTVTSNADCASPTTAANSYTMTVSPAVTPIASVTATPSATVCPGATATLNATATHGGAAPSYTWYRNGINVGAGPAYSYVAGDGDVIFAILNSNADCRTTSTVFSNNVEIAIDSPMLPEFAISAFPGTSIVSGQSVTFTAVDVNGGTGATYEWRLNGVLAAGVTGKTYTPTAPLASNDQITCKVTSNNACGSRSTTLSVYMTVSTVGVAQVLNGGLDVKVVPNPNKGTFSIKGSIVDGNSDVTIEIANMLGQVVYTGAATAQQGQIDHAVQMNNTMASGMYILTLRSGTQSQVIHFVID